MLKGTDQPTRHSFIWANRSWKIQYAEKLQPLGWEDVARSTLLLFCQYMIGEQINSAVQYAIRDILRRMSKCCIHNDRIDQTLIEVQLPNSCTTEPFRKSRSRALTIFLATQIITKVFLILIRLSLVSLLHLIFDLQLWPQLGSQRPPLISQ